VTGVTPDRLNEIAGLVDELPEEYRVAAFRELLRDELGRNYLAEPGGRVGARGPIARGEGVRGDGESATVPRPAWFEGIVERMPELDAVASGSRNLQAAWGVVELNKRGEPATPATIERLIRDELGVAPEDKANLSYRLGNEFTPKYTTRRKVEKGQGFRYEATRAIAGLFPKESDSA